jgi:hypothetical protein
MKTMRTSLLRTFFALALFALVPSCAPETPAEGFTLAIQLSGVTATAVDSMRLTFAPVMEGTMTAHFVQPTHGTQFENGDIMISVDSVSGLMTMTITGSYFRAHALFTDTSAPRLELVLWSDDTQMHGMPQVRATVVHMGMQVATGVAYLPSWPLPLGGMSDIDVPCMSGFEMQCTAP